MFSRSSWNLWARLTSLREAGICSERYAGVVPRGRVELPTPAFSGPRSTGELPRHRAVTKILRKMRSGAKRKGVEADGWLLRTRVFLSNSRDRQSGDWRSPETKCEVRRRTEKGSPLQNHAC